MKTALFYLPIFLLCSVLVQGQNTDSLAVVRGVDSLIQVSRTLTGQREYDKALEVNAAAEKLAQERFGKASAVYGRCCVNRGRVNYFKGDLQEAEKGYVESITVQEKSLGKEHPDYAKSLYSLGILYRVMGAYEKAEPFSIQAKAIREKTLGLEHPEYALSVNSLGALYSIMGVYEKAESYFLEAKTILEKTLGKEHPDYAASLNNLGILYGQMGAYEKAEPLFRESTTIKEKNLGREHPEYAISLYNLGVLYSTMGAYEKAEQLYLQAKAILGKTLGREHPEYAVSLSNLGGLYIVMGVYEKAEQLYLEAKAIVETILGKEHPEYAKVVANLGEVYTYLGAYAQAEPYFLEAKIIQEKVLGQNHPEYAFTLLKLSILYETQNGYAGSEPLLKNYAVLRQFSLNQSAAYLSERQLAAYAATFQQDGHRLSTFLFTRLSKNKPVGTLPSMCFDHNLFHKGFLLGAAARLNTLASSSPESEEINLRLKIYRRRLATEYAKPVVERMGVPELEEKAEATEKDLARTVAGYAEAVRQVKWQEVWATLKRREAAVEFVHFTTKDTLKVDLVMYAALLLKPNAKAPVFIPLFEEKQLLPLLAQNRASQGAAPLYASRGAKPLAASQGGSAELFELLWSPLKRHLKGIKTVWYSPSGALHRVNFDAIPLPGGRTLSDKYRLARLGSTRSLVVPDKVTIGSNSAILFGGIQYELDTTAVLMDSTRLKQAETSGSSGLSFSYADRNAPGRGENWTYLPGTAKEVSDIKALFQKSDFSSRIYSKDAATEELFKSLGGPALGPSPRILHLATHGFFFPDPNPQSAIRNPQFAEPVFKLSDHPMIRSGLILAGGNHAWKTGKPLRENMEDGILTAYEISQMNLSNTEMVVLSACETGLGDIQGNEGVYGLQRAFKIAGAKYLIMSLWQVPDQETSVFMTTFYRHWLESKMPIPDAFRATQREMRERFGDPYRWAGFVLVE